MLCPVCKLDFLSSKIEKHVDECIANVFVPCPNMSKQKRLLPVEDKNEIQQQKKRKTEFGTGNNEDVPLAERMRPKTLEEYIGQRQVVGENMLLKQLLSKGHILSMIIWGPPGCGKSSLANVISHTCKQAYAGKIHIMKLSAVSSGVNTIREAVATAKNYAKMNEKTIVFMDEIHRFNKLQQDIFLPHVEAGTFTLIGTTTENPSYSLNSALLSRCRVFSLKKLTVSDTSSILEKALKLIRGKLIDPHNKSSKNDSKDSQNFEPFFLIDRAVIDWLAEVSDGDARVALNALELAVKAGSSQRNETCREIKLQDIKESLKQVHTLSNGKTNITHHIYSALHKSIQGGNSNAGLYWLARLMAIKEDPVNIARRLLRISSEDVGLEDELALSVAVRTLQGCEMIGMPECDVLLGQCVTYLAKAPKSRLIYNALNAAKDTIFNHHGPQPDVPMFLKDRSSKAKLQAVLGKNKNNLLGMKEESKTYLPLSLTCRDFYREAR